jgi:beta-glucanase (GH16 family)
VVLLLGLLLAVTSASFSAATSSSTRSTAAGAAARGVVHVAKKKTPKPCAGQAPRKPDGTRWRCSFYDDFSGTKLNRHKWGVVRTAQNGFHIGPECYVDKRDTVSVSHGALHLTVHRTAAPFTCVASPNGRKHYQSQDVAGSLTTMDTFTQTYGRYQIRAAFPATKIGGLHSAIWMFPKKISRVAFGNDYGEIDIAEYFTRWPGRSIPVLHYKQSAAVPQSEWTNNQCWISHPERFHNYTLEWTPDTITISYDGKVCVRNDNWTPRWPLKHPAPFDKPFALILTQGLGVRGNSPTDATPLPATMHVDWVRVWR